MNSYLVSDKPIIYTDMNVFRYLACGDISIAEPERFKWVYSHVHLDEIYRNGNQDALEGMKLLKAIEISDVLNQDFQSEGNIVIRDFIDPYLRYEQHLEAIAGYEGTSDHMIEHLIRSFGADNFNELSETPEQMRNEIERITSIIPDDRRENLINKASAVSNDMNDTIEKHLKNRMPIDKTRSALGITSENRKGIEKSKSAIDDIWDLISPSIQNITKNQFFGFEPIQGIEGVQHTQHGAISGAYIVLNMIGISPDKGLAKRDKIKNVMSDGQHAGMASYCNALVSADRGIINKSSCIYSYLNNITNALHFEFQKGFQLSLGVSET
ncbi:hypothetical protein [Shewanella pealeana]|uniref:Uncharacterized protein n=1 Tax=Shewanella pealeana (strain ATCC 700345 / ANG-SQ1) TaxID=398579 RepID=A8H6Q0_SHEPA|nr:hypothetical protein [Shewanella pealeana]ABV88237.1 hypothetical protein Spea_2920 [Shewanella pealeana ATCC 700345]